MQAASVLPLQAGISAVVAAAIFPGDAAVNRIYDAQIPTLREIRTCAANPQLVCDV